VKTTIFMFKGIECKFSKKANDIVPTDAHKNHLLETFFHYEPIDSIKWVNTKTIHTVTLPEDCYPIYRIGNGENELLLWPMLVESDLLLGVQSADEAPELKDRPAEILVQDGRLKTES
jgi:hypothetical protein